MLHENVTYTIHSNGVIYSPNVFRWILETILPFDVSKGRHMLRAMGLPADAVDCIIDGDFAWNIQPKDETVTVTCFY